MLLPVVVLSRFQHPFIVCNAARSELRPADLKRRRVGIRSYCYTVDELFDDVTRKLD